jgi:hypothetical protein
MDYLISYYGTVRAFQRHNNRFVLSAEEKTVEHLTLQCSFSREVWYFMLLPIRMHRFTPRQDDCLGEWWPKLERATSKQNKKELNALVSLVARALWLERTARVFEAL